MRRSILALVMGIISSSIEFIFSLIMVFILSLVSDIANSLSDNVDISLTIVLILGWVMVLGAILAIVGAALCGKRSRLGGILILVGVLMCLGITIFNIISVIKDNSAAASNIALIFFSSIPVLLMIISGFVGIFAKTKTVNQDEFVNTTGETLN